MNTVGELFYLEPKGRPSQEVVSQRKSTLNTRTTKMLQNKLSNATNKFTVLTKNKTPVETRPVRKKSPDVEILVPTQKVSLPVVSANSPEAVLNTSLNEEDAEVAGEYETPSERVESKKINSPHTEINELRNSSNSPGNIFSENRGLKSALKSFNPIGNSESTGEVYQTFGTEQSPKYVEVKSIEMSVTKAPLTLKTHKVESSTRKVGIIHF